MSIARHHAEWLSLIEQSGPFLSMPVLMKAFPQGLEAHDPERFRTLRMAFEEWEDDQESGQANSAVHFAWIKFVLGDLLDLSEVVAEGQAIPQTLQVNGSFPGENLRPDLIVKNPPGHPNAGKARLLIQTYPLRQDLDRPVSGSRWKSSPGDRMIELLQGTGVRLGLVTNGDRWMLVDAPKNETHGFASWYASLWLEEPLTLRAFRSLLSSDRFFNVPDKDTLEELLRESASNQQEVTDQLGYQVRRAVEVLVQTLDRADQDNERKLLAAISETDLYEASLTVMMRLVFMFCAEERELFPIKDDFYGDNYALSTIRQQLRQAADQHGEEILERRYDAWCRLLATFRAVFGGVHHDRFRLPAYGGNLFDPDRFPFLEGRPAGTSWRETAADPLPVDNRTVLHLLEALQILQIKVPGGGPAEARRLSFRALDIEQIGHVYEGLLDHTAKRAPQPVLGLAGAKDKEPEITLSELDTAKAKGKEAFVDYLKERTGRSEKALAKALDAELDMLTASRFEAACGAGGKLWEQVKPFAALVREDTFGYPVVIPKGSIYVTTGTDRRSSGTHYTPRSLTEPIVQYTLEPLVYVGPSEGKPRDQWTLRPVGELLDLKICDMACGSGAFLVEACRYMSKRLVEAWDEIERKAGGIGKVRILPDGKVSQGRPPDQPIPIDPDERMAYARRLVAQRCLYGVDINPLACEMAKLSLWLLTLAKDKPFTFLNHAMRCGDSLVGIHDIEQLKKFNLHPGEGKDKYVFTAPLEAMVDEAVALRLKIESNPAATVEDAEAQKHLLNECEEKLSLLKSAADMLVSAEFKPGNASLNQEHRDHAAVVTGHYLADGNATDFRLAAKKDLNGRKTFHWPLEFPEVFAGRGGFHVFVGNPPFLGGRRISTLYGSSYLAYLTTREWQHAHGNADFVTYFFLRASQLQGPTSTFGLLSTNTIAQGDTADTGLRWLVNHADTQIIWTRPSFSWPGDAAVIVALVIGFKGRWSGPLVIDGTAVSSISPTLTSIDTSSKPLVLPEHSGRSAEGSKLYGKSFVLDADTATSLRTAETTASAVVRPFITGQDINESMSYSASRWCIDFRTNDLDTVSERWPLTLEYARKHILPERQSSSDPTARKLWWQHQRPRSELYALLRGMDQVLVRARVTSAWGFVFLPTDQVFADKITLFLFNDFDAFAVLQSSFHEKWAWHWGTTMKTDLNYSHTDCFQTFPFPTDTLSRLKPVGEQYYVARQTVVITQRGLMKAYHYVNNPDNSNADIQKLRELHVEMDKAVAAAYGWDDLALDHGFHPTKQGVRFTISEPARREVLARLLKLNHERYAEEVAQGLHEQKAKRAASVKKAETKAMAKTAASGQSLFEIMSYPSTEMDKTICGGLLSLVEQSKAISSVGSLTALLLLTHPEWCRAFLSQRDQNRLGAAVKEAPKSLFVGDSSIRWKDARDYVEARRAISIDRTTGDQPLAGTQQLAAIKASLPVVPDEIVLLALTANAEIDRLRNDVANATQEQKRLLAILDEQAKTAGLTAA